MRINDNGIDRDMTSQEIAEYQATVETMQAEDEVRQAEIASRVAAHQSAIDKLSALGLTGEEIQALIGQIATAKISE